MNGNGDVSALCFSTPHASWTNRDDAVTCTRCRARLAEIRQASGVTYPPELLPGPDEGDEGEVIVVDESTTPPVEALVERLEKATGPDRDLDAAIFNAMPDAERPEIAYREDNCITLRQQGRDPQFHDGWLRRRADRPDDKYPNDLPRLTASLDAAVSLCERVLPALDMDLDTTVTESGRRWCCAIWDAGAEAFQADSVTGPLAVCLAILRALAATKERP